MADSDDLSHLRTVWRLFDSFAKARLPQLAPSLVKEKYWEEFGGWSFAKKVQNSDLYAVIALNRFLSASRRHFWVGFYSAKKSQIDRMVSAAPAYLNPNFVLRPKHVEMSDGIYVLKHNVQRPVARERWAEHFSQENYYGYYVPQNRKKPSEIAKESAEFFENTLSLLDLAALDRNLNNSIAASQQLTREARLKRLQAAPSQPAITISKQIRFERNADVIAERLFLAGGLCDVCKKPAPFYRALTGKPFLEVHHRVPLALGGDDTVENTAALCPNCHRQEHYGTSRLSDASSGSI